MFRVEYRTSDCVGLVTVQEELVTTCSVCQEPLHVGDMVQWNANQRRGALRHVSCQETKKAH